MNPRAVGDATCILVFLSMVVVTVTASSFPSYQSATGLACAILALLPVLFRRFRVVSLPGSLTVMVAVALGLHGTGVMYGFYDTKEMFDVLTHVFSSFMLAQCVFLVLCYYQVSNGRVRFTGLSMPLMVAMVMLSFGVYWEVAEFLIDAVAGTVMQYGPMDTVLDMLSNAMGCTLASLYVAYGMRGTTPEEVVADLDMHPVFSSLTR